MKPYYSDDTVALYLGDCLSILQSSGLGFVSLVLTDPPYNLRAEDIALEGRSAMKRDFGEWDSEWDAGVFMAAVFPLVRKGGSVLSFCSDRLLWEYRRAPGWKPRGTIVWEKANPAPHPRPAYVSATEWIVWMQKNGAAATWNGGGYVPNVLHFPACTGEERTVHPTQKPEALIIDLMVRHSCAGDLVLDPYCGSGTTLVAAKRIGRRSMGIELDERYCEIAAKRLSQGALPLEFSA